ncbi:MAG: hypothetical protein H6721_05520 [Sandaracinus sp.]|nr:hypothetical protein [Sandaracinus sp.]
MSSPLEAARRGELDVAVPHAELSSEPDATALEAAALLALLAPRAPQVPDALLARLASGGRVAGDPHVTTRALVDLALDAVLRGRPRRLALIRRAAADFPVAAVHVAAWDDVLHERAVDVAGVLEASRALRHVPGLLAEAEALAALAALAEGRIDEARERARLGSRIARTDGFLPTEYLAHLTLARVRRFDARWYLASRILDALARVAPPSWAGWLGWERLLVGTPVREATSEAEASEWQASTRDLAALLDAASRGDRAAFVAAAERPTAWPWLARERARVRALLDLEVDAPDELAAWLAGEGTRAPHGMDGLAGSASLLGAAGERAGIAVVASPGTHARRVGLVGLGLLGRETPASYELQHERVLSALVALLFASGQRASETELFRRVYGFAFVADKHGGVLRTLLYRMRQELAERGEIVREGDDLVLRLAAPVAIVDPTTATDLRELVLRFLAENGGRASARDVAEALGVPLRTVQDALGQLVGDESCRRERSGRVHEYALEDTTFFAPTITRLGAWRPG